MTLLHVESEEEESLSSHFFKVDALVDNVTLLITGSLSECILSSPSGWWEQSRITEMFADDGMFVMSSSYFMINSPSSPH